MSNQRSATTKHFCASVLSLEPSTGPAGLVSMLVLVANVVPTMSDVSDRVVIEAEVSLISNNKPFLFPRHKGALYLSHTHQVMSQKSEFAYEVISLI